VHVSVVVQPCLQRHSPSKRLIYSEVVTAKAMTIIYRIFISCLIFFNRSYMCQSVWAVGIHWCNSISLKVSLEIRVFINFTGDGGSKREIKNGTTASPSLCVVEYKPSLPLRLHRPRRSWNSTTTRSSSAASPTTPGCSWSSAWTRASQTPTTRRWVRREEQPANGYYRHDFKSIRGCVVLKLHSKCVYRCVFVKGVTCSHKPKDPWTLGLQLTIILIIHLSVDYFFDYSMNLIIIIKH